MGTTKVRAIRLLAVFAGLGCTRKGKPYQRWLSCYAESPSNLEAFPIALPACSAVLPQFFSNAMSYIGFIPVTFTFLGWEKSPGEVVLV